VRERRASDFSFVVVRTTDENCLESISFGLMKNRGSLSVSDLSNSTLYGAVRVGCVNDDMARE
jgi:hypothetical protein